jgi:hypothetical protein
MNQNENKPHFSEKSISSDIWKLHDRRISIRVSHVADACRISVHPHKPAPHHTAACVVISKNSSASF